MCCTSKVIGPKGPKAHNKYTLTGANIIRSWVGSVTERKKQSKNENREEHGGCGLSEKLHLNYIYTYIYIYIYI